MCLNKNSFHLLLVSFVFYIHNSTIQKVTKHQQSPISFKKLYNWHPQFAMDDGSFLNNYYNSIYNANAHKQSIDYKT